MTSAVCAVAAAAVIAAMMTSCSSPQRQGEVSEVNGGRQVVVPALWADPETGAGGVEPATVWVDTDREGDQLAYELNLADVQAKGGGPQWQAATSSAAYLGTLISGLNPNDVACAFDITGPIDGPSAGAILTVGVLAALNRQSIDPRVTMTGTISPEGSIGPVGFVPYKLQAAVAEGFETVVLPASMTDIVDPDSGSIVDTKEYAQALGIDVVFVRSIDQAYQHFTGRSLKQSSTNQEFVTADFPSLSLAQKLAAVALSAEVDSLLSSVAQPPAELADLAAAATAASNGSDPVRGFALGVETLDQVAALAAKQEYVSLNDSAGAGHSQQKLLESVLESQTLVQQEWDQALLDVDSLSDAQKLALPSSLGWLTYSRAVLKSIENALESSELSPDLVITYAELAAQVTAEALVVFPQELRVLKAVPSTHIADSRAVSEFVSGYTEFLVEAGNASVTYIREVAGVSESTPELAVTDVIPVVVELAKEANAIDPEVGPLAIELEESSVAMTFYVAATSAITSFQVFDNSGLWLDPEQLQMSANEYIDESVAQSTALTRAYAGYLLGKNLNAGVSVWSSNWANAAFVEFSTDDLRASGASIALNELWYDVITVLSMNAFAQPQ